MKKLFRFIAILFVTGVSGQQGYKHLNLSTGLNLQGNSVHTLSYEINKGNFNAWDISIEAHISDFDAIETINLGETLTEFPEGLDPRFIINDSTARVPFNKKEEIFQAAVYYKPMLIKKNNVMFHLRYGGGVGRSNSSFLLSAGAGFELSYTLPGQFVLFLQQHNQYFINIDKRFRHGLQIGLKIPL